MMDSVWFALLSLCHYFALKWTGNLFQLSGASADVFEYFFIGTAVYSLLFYFLRMWTRTHLWKLFHPTLDFSGWWFYKINLADPKDVSDNSSSDSEDDAEAYYNARLAGGFCGIIRVD